MYSMYLSWSTKCSVSVNEDVEGVSVYCQRSIDQDVNWMSSEMMIKGIDLHMVVDACGTHNPNIGVLADLVPHQSEHLDTHLYYNCGKIAIHQA